MWGYVKRLFVKPPPRVTQRVAEVGNRVRSRQLPVEMPAARLAIAFLYWLQRDDGRVGDVLAAELMEMYFEMCGFENYRVLTWQRVAHELSMLIGEGSKVKWVNGKQHRVWHIPKRVPQRVASIERIMPVRPRRVLGEMATRVEAA